MHGFIYYPAAAASPADNPATAVKIIQPVYLPKKYAALSTFTGLYKNTSYTA